MYHPNPKGTGTAVKLELRPAHDAVAGSVIMTLAQQKTIGTRTADGVTLPTFDWHDAVCLKLDIIDLTQILQVLRGEQESLADGKGLFHRSAGATAIIKFEHRIEPVYGYYLDVTKKPLVGDPKRVGFLFSNTEAYALVTVLEHSLVAVAFGV